MTNQHAAVNNNTSDHFQTWILRVYIHCDGCKKKVFKVLQSIDGVYKTEIDSLQQKAIVTGSVDGDTLVQKLLKSGKHAEILPESFKATATAESAAGNSKKKKKKKQNNEEKNDETTGNNNNEHVDEEKEESESATAEGSDGGNEQEIAPPAVATGDCTNSGGGGKKKKKKKKGDKEDDNAPPDGDTKADNAPATMEELNLGRPGGATPYDLPAYQNYYPTPAYGVSYSTSYPSTESSYYTPPVYGYAQSHPSIYYPPPPPPSYYPRSAFDDHDDENVNGRSCTIM